MTDNPTARRHRHAAAPIRGPRAGRCNPLTPLTAVVCLAVLVLVVDMWQFSLGVILLSAAVSLVIAPTQRQLTAAVAISLPAAAGLLIMYAPFGHTHLWWILTADGTARAAELAARFAAVTTVALVGSGFINLDRLMRTLQPRLPSAVVYVIGATARLFPLARQRYQMIQQIFASRGMDMASARTKMSMLIPLVVGMVDDAAQRSRPLQQTGIGQPGPKTVLRPVADPPVEKALRWTMLLATAVALGVILALPAVAQSQPGEGASQSGGVSAAHHNGADLRETHHSGAGGGGH